MCPTFRVGVATPVRLTDGPLGVFFPSRAFFSVLLLNYSMYLPLLFCSIIHACCSRIGINFE